MRPPGSTPPPEGAPLQTFLYRSPLLQVGSFRVAPSDPRFRDSGPVREDLFVFPRTSVRLRYAGRRPFVANPNRVTFYNRGQVYFRDKLSEEGDRSDWFAFDRAVVIEALERYDPAVLEHPERPSSFSHGPSDPQSYLVQRMIVRHLAAGEPVDGLGLEENLLHVLFRLLDSACQARDLPRRRRAAEEPGREWVEAVEALLSLRFREALSLPEIAGKVGVSVSYLCRRFRRATGTTLHAYRDRLRLWTALELVADPKTDLTDLGLDLGYSSHSHFTASFRRTFRTTPTELRRTASARRLRELAARLLPAPPPGGRAEPVVASREV